MRDCLLFMYSYKINYIIIHWFNLYISTEEIIDEEILLNEQRELFTEAIAHPDSSETALTRHRDVAAPFWLFCI